MLNGTRLNTSLSIIAVILSINTPKTNFITMSHFDQVCEGERINSGFPEAVHHLL